MTDLGDSGAPTDLLLPCPFCGEAATLTSTSLGAHWAGCENDKCLVGPSTGTLETRAEALTAWNDRPILAEGFARQQQPEGPLCEMCRDTGLIRLIHNGIDEGITAPCLACEGRQSPPAAPPKEDA